MTAKKRWLSKICPDSQDASKRTQVIISWSSSDSDEEIPTKKNKSEPVSDSKLIKSNLKQNINEEKYFPTNIESNIHDTKLNCKQSQYGLSSGLSTSPKARVTEPFYNGVNANESSETISSRYCESPIINKLTLEELSPLLVQTSEDFDITKESSPVLGSKKRILRKIRSKYKQKHRVQQIDATSPDLFKTQSTQIIDSDSPELKCNTSQIQSNNILLTEHIDSFPSYHSSRAINSDVDSDLSRKGSVSLYHQPLPKRKRYKKGGLASLLQKSLHLQRTRASIWQHEIYTKKTDNIIDFDGSKAISFVIKNKWKEYGSTVLECSSKRECNIISCTNVKRINSFIIIIGFSTNLNVVFEVNGYYKLFPPYNVKTINYKSNEISCYSNVSRLIPLKGDL